MKKPNILFFIFTIVSLILLTVLMFIFSFITPYETWDSTVVNYDTIDVLKFFWLSAFFVSTLFGFAWWKLRRFVSVIWFLLVIISTIKTVVVFAI